MRRMLAALTLFILLFMLWGDTVAAPAFAGSGNWSDSRGGLTCNVNWYNTWGSASCRGISSQRWRLTAACAWQADYTGAWHSGPGSDWAECTFGIQNTSVQWGE